MVLIDPGLENGMEFGHTDYLTGEGRFITHSENEEERYINPELSVKERNRISQLDCAKRNKHHVYLYTKNNTQIRGVISYNPITEALSFVYGIYGNNGKKLFFLNKDESKRETQKRVHKRAEGRTIVLLCEKNTAIVEQIKYNYANDYLSFSTQITSYHGKKLVRLN